MSVPLRLRPGVIKQHKPNYAPALEHTLWSHLLWGEICSFSAAKGNHHKLSLFNVPLLLGGQHVALQGFHSYTCISSLSEFGRYQIIPYVVGWEDSDDKELQIFLTLKILIYT